MISYHCNIVWQLNMHNIIMYIVYYVFLVPYGPPENIHATPQSHSIFVSWDLPIISKRNGIIILYSLFVNNQRYPTNRTEYNISGLLPYTDYEIQIAAHTSIGPGPRSELLLFTTMMFCMLYLCKCNCIIQYNATLYAYALVRCIV